LLGKNSLDSNDVGALVYDQLFNLKPYAANAGGKFFGGFRAKRVNGNQ
jgi:hypothetical protein